jgi:hypothetical protein
MMIKATGTALPHLVVMGKENGTASLKRGPGTELEAVSSARKLKKRSPPFLQQAVSRIEQN